MKPEKQKETVRTMSFSLTSPRHLPPTTSEIVNIVAKKNQDKRKCEYFASEMPKIPVCHAPVLP